MTRNHKKENVAGTGAMHEFYMNIINCVPDIVYWVDVNCNLMGCNKQFVDLLGLQALRDFNGTPYQQMKKFGHWSDERIEELKLDDMNVIFAKKPRYNVVEKPIVDANNTPLHFQSTRVPMFNDNKEISGLIVVLTRVHAESSTATTIKTQGKKRNIKKSASKKLIPNVLMIEDNVIAQNVEKALLTALNCNVDIAATGDKALELFGPGKYDLVLMDIGLEDTSGYVVAKQLRHLEKDSQHHVPIIALTGYEADVIKYDCKQYFMEGAITKPLTSEQAEQIIKHYVHHLDVPVNGLKSS